MRDKLVLIGWYGNHNLGDEILLASMIETFRKNNIETGNIVVISDNPIYTAHLHGVGSLRLGNIGNLIGVLLSARICVLGGGGLIKDRRCIEWLSRLLLFRVFGARTMCFAIGASPISRRRDILAVKLVLNHFCDSITVRDKSSRVILKEYVRREIVVTADPALLLRIKAVRLGKRPRMNDLRIGLCLKEYNHEDVSEIRRILDRDSYIRRIARDCDAILEGTNRTLMVIRSDTGDLKDMRYLYSTMRYRERVDLIEDELTPAGFFDLVRGLDLMISQRLHPLIVASLLRVAMLAIPYAPKVRSYMAELGSEQFVVEYPELGTGKLGEKVTELMEKRKGTMQQTDRFLGSLRVRAQLGVDLLRELADIASIQTRGGAQE
jgi:polysaccharide pyruvyl transferase CsaB